MAFHPNVTGMCDQVGPWMREGCEDVEQKGEGALLPYAIYFTAVTGVDTILFIVGKVAAHKLRNLPEETTLLLNGEGVKAKKRKWTWLKRAEEWFPGRQLMGAGITYGLWQLYTFFDDPARCEQLAIEGNSTCVSLLDNIGKHLVGG